MSDPLVDTNVFIRLLAGDDPQKQDRSRQLFDRIADGALSATALTSVIAETVFVLSSPRLYNLPRVEILELLTPLVGLPGLQVQRRQAVLQALQIYAGTPRLNFVDALLAATALQSDSPVVYSYDADFDRIPGITRVEP